MLDLIFSSLFKILEDFIDFHFRASLGYLWNLHTEPAFLILEKRKRNVKNTISAPIQIGQILALTKLVRHPKSTWQPKSHPIGAFRWFRQDFLSDILIRTFKPFSLQLRLKERSSHRDEIRRKGYFDHVLENFALKTAEKLCLALKKRLVLYFLHLFGVLKKFLEYLG